jgi:hypothetical protein
MKKGEAIFFGKAMLHSELQKLLAYRSADLRKMDG